MEAEPPRKKAPEALDDSRRDSFLRSLVSDSFSKRSLTNRNFRRDEDARSVRSHLLL